MEPTDDVGRIEVRVLHRAVGQVRSQGDHPLTEKKEGHAKCDHDHYTLGTIEPTGQH